MKKLIGVFTLALLITPMAFANTTVANTIVNRANAFHNKFVQGKFGSVDSLARDYLGQMSAILIRQMAAKDCSQLQSKLPIAPSGLYVFSNASQGVKVYCTSRATSAVVVNNLF